MAEAMEMELASQNTSSIVASESEPATNTNNNNNGGAQTDDAKPKEAAPIFPLLHNNAGADSDQLGSSVPAKARQNGAPDDNDEEEPAVARPFHRTTSPDPAARNARAAVEEEEDEEDGTAASAAHDGEAPKKKPRAAPRMHKFSLYETASRFYIVGGDVTEKRYRILKIDRTAPPAQATDDSASESEEESELSITDDKTVYSQKDMNQLLDTIDDGNKGTGGLKLRCTTWGLLGFIKFTGPWYMLLITKKSTVALIGGHYVYQIEGTELIPLMPRGYKADQRSANNAEESRFLAILHNLDLTRSFYYSYSYDITRTLQYNITRERKAIAEGRPMVSGGDDDDFNSMFVWNTHLLKPVVRAINAPYDWCRPIIHGYIDQAAISIYGRTAHITIIARRSRWYAGARFLKRGANDLGYVANDVETEQIVSESVTTSLHAPGPKLFASPNYTSYVQHRGSIPLYWTQDNTGVTPKPPIELNLVDPFYTAAALHFDNLFERYGAPVYVLNLVKSRERTARESKLLDEYGKALEYLNQFLPAEKKIIYRAWDMSRAAKSRDQDVIGTLESIAEEVLATTGFFHNGDGSEDGGPFMQVQNGVARTNCIDCLDRTNAAQFVIGKRALGRQLHALGIRDTMSVDYDTDAVNLFTHMYHDHGDTIAVQYGGSQLVNTMETYRKINQWTSHSRDMIESFKRYYNNSFLDGQRQEAYNLFLGNYIFAQGQPMLWDLATDYYLHHANPRNWLEKPSKHYIHWFTPEFLKERTLTPYPSPSKYEALRKPVSFYDDYWLEYYRPSTLSSFLKMFPYKMNSTIKYLPLKSTQDGRYDLSPFRQRVEVEGGDDQDRKKNKKEVTILDPQDFAQHGEDSDTPMEKPQSRGLSLQQLRWRLSGSVEKSMANGANGAIKDRPRDAEQLEAGDTSILFDNSGGKVKATALEKTRAAQWTFTQVVHESLNPTVSTEEAEDYSRWISHPQTLPLVVSAETPVDEVDAEYQDYVNGNWQSDGLTATPGHEDEYAMYADLLKVGENPLTVTEEDALKKRYKAYRKWLRGKSLFKQQPVD